MDVLEMGDATRLLVQMHGSYVQLTHLPYKEGAATSAQGSEGSQAWVGQSLRTSSTVPSTSASSEAMARVSGASASHGNGVMWVAAFRLTFEKSNLPATWHR